MKAEKTLILLTYFGNVVSGIIRKPQKSPIELIEDIKESVEEIKEFERLASIGRDYEYLSQHEQIASLPTVENMQKLADKRRKKEGAAE